MKSIDGKGMPLEPLIETGYYSGLYGQKEEIKQVCFSTNSDSIISTIIKK